MFLEIPGDGSFVFFESSTQDENEPEDEALYFGFFKCVSELPDAVSRLIRFPHVFSLIFKSEHSSDSSEEVRVRQDFTIFRYNKFISSSLQ